MFAGLVQVPVAGAVPAENPAGIVQPSAAETALRAVNPDELSPKEALDLLYKLRGLVGLK